MRRPANLLLLTVILLCRPGFSEEKIYRLGDRIQSFQLTDDAGKSVRLSNYNGKIVVLNFYFLLCSGCNEEAPALEKEIWSRYRDKGVVLLGIATHDTPAQAIKFRKRHSLTFPLLVDTKGVLAKRFGFSQFPSNAVIGRDGKLASAPPDVKHLIYDLEKRVR